MQALTLAMHLADGKAFVAWPDAQSEARCDGNASLPSMRRALRWLTPTPR